ncbi:MAG: hypothetical protein Q8Q39_01615 [bacterium]|nr:hypothetical protein [bacterium]
MGLLPFSFDGLAPQLATAAGLWWIWLPIMLIVIFQQIWLVYAQTKFKAATDWALLEIRIPRELKRTPKAMEQIFAGIHSLRNAPGDFVETYLDGEVTYWFSLEIVSFSGDIHFYVRTPTKYRNIVESFFYAQYPDIQIADASDADYMTTLPRTHRQIEESGLRLWGTELKLAKDDAYPIRTYIEFSSPVEEEQLDPVSALTELLGKVRRGEKIFIQMLIRPADETWIHKSNALLKQLKESTALRPKAATAEQAASFTAIQRTPGETDLLKAIDRNLTKPGFETIIRVMYMATKEVYSVNLVRRGVYSCFNQYAVASMNSFKQNANVRTEARWSSFPYFFPNRRRAAKERRIWRNFRERRMPDKGTVTGLAGSGMLASLLAQSSTFVLNTEELATIWHLPSHLVLTAPFVRRVESRKMGPPAGLPIFGGEEETPWTNKKGEKHQAGDKP